MGGMCSGDLVQATNKRGPGVVLGLDPAMQAIKQPKFSGHEQTAHLHSSSAVDAVSAAIPRAWQQLQLPASSSAVPVQGMYNLSLQHPQAHPVDLRQIMAAGDTQSISAQTGAVGSIDGLNHLLHAAQIGIQPAVAVPGAVPVGEVPVLAETPWWPTTHSLHSALPGNLHGLVNFMLDTQIAAHFQQHATGVPARDPVGACADGSNIAGQGK